MLSSFNRHFNETVFRGPDTEGGSGGANEVVVDQGLEGGTDDVVTDDGGEPNEPLTVREQIKKSIAETSEPAPASKPKKGDKSGRFADRTQKADTSAPTEPTTPEPSKPIVTAPEGISKEALAEWDKTPPAVQAAFLKRIDDTTKGVNELRQRYSLIDQAIQPHTDALRQMNATPGEAVNRMFLWFKALAGKPQDAFPALAQSMGIDWTKLAAPKSADPAAAAAPAPVNGAPEIPEPVKQYMGQLEQQVRNLTQYVQQVGGRFGEVEQNINTQNEARTRENLNIWSNGKKYFEEVRQDMAKLIETGVVPLKDGQVDLDTAYERAIYFNPEVRAKVLAEQQQANNEVQQKSDQAATTANQSQVGRARKAAVSLPASTTPGASVGNGALKKKPGEKLSVRDSLKASIAQLRDQ